MNASNLNSIAIMVLGIGVIGTAWTNIQQAQEIVRIQNHYKSAVLVLDRKIKCLEQGRVYVGDEFCSWKEAESLD